MIPRSVDRRMRKSDRVDKEVTRRCSNEQMWITEAQFHWGLLETKEHASELSHPRSKEAWLFVLQLPASINKERISSVLCTDLSLPETVSGMCGRCLILMCRMNECLGY